MNEEDKANFIKEKIILAREQLKPEGEAKKAVWYALDILLDYIELMLTPFEYELSDE